MLIRFLFHGTYLFLLYPVLCTLVPDTSFCSAGTDISLQKDEIQDVLHCDAIPAIKNPEFVPAEEADI